ncbi:MAG: FHA domain-containing protein [Fibrobacter sp.]|nr:FHA domain-containing protein [Fibrobacter sp.]
MKVCVFCNQEIPDDSIFCDLCGMEILVCVKCGAFGKGKFCGKDGGALVSIKNSVSGSTPQMVPPLQVPLPQAAPLQVPPLQAASQSAYIQKNVPPTINQIPVPPFPGAQQPMSTIRDNHADLKSTQPITSGINLHNTVCKLINRNLNLEFQVNDQDLLGRSQGPHAAILSSMGRISGRHAIIRFNSQSGWQIEDCNSTNGTFVQSQQISPNTPVKISNGNLIRLANVEFLVQIEGQSGFFQDGNSSMTIRM